MCRPGLSRSEFRPESAEKISIAAITRVGPGTRQTTEFVRTAPKQFLQTVRSCAFFTWPTRSRRAAASIRWWRSPVDRKLADRKLPWDVCPERAPFWMFSRKLESEYLSLILKADWSDSRAFVRSFV